MDEAKTPEELKLESDELLARAEAEAASKEANLAETERNAIAAHLPGLRGLAEAALVDPSFGLEVLVERGKLVVEPGGPVLVAEDGTRTRATVESLRAAAAEVSPVLARAAGKAGPGGREPREVRGGGGLDLAKVSDRSYWKANRRKLLERLKSKPGGAA